MLGVKSLKYCHYGFNLLYVGFESLCLQIFLFVVENIADIFVTILFEKHKLLIGF